MKASVVVLPGDGIGPEVTAEAVRVLEAVARRGGHQLRFAEHLMGGCSIDRHGVALTDEVLRACQASDAVLLGAVGGPRWDDPQAKVRPEQGLLGLRKGLGVFANLRPVKVRVDGEVHHTAAEGDGPVNALDAALRKALSPRHPQVAELHLVDYKVRILDGSEGTAAVTRVLVDTQRGTRRWSTVGASTNIIEASWRALVDGLEYGLTIAEA